MNDLVYIRSRVITLNLYGMDDVASLPIDRLNEVYNGTGPECLPDLVRTILDNAFETFLPAVMVHDVDFSKSDATVAGFNAANDRMFRNCVKCASDIPWWEWRRYARLVQAIIIYRYCAKYGWPFWVSANKKNERK